MSTGRPVRARPVCFRTAWSRFGREENAFLKGRGVVRRTGVFYAEEESEAPRQDLTCGRRRDCAKEREAERRQRLSARARTEPNIADLLALMLGLSARARTEHGRLQTPVPFLAFPGGGGGDQPICDAGIGEAAFIRTRTRPSGKRRLKEGNALRAGNVLRAEKA